MTSDGSNEVLLKNSDKVFFLVAMRCSHSQGVFFFQILNIYFKVTASCKRDEKHCFVTSLWFFPFADFHCFLTFVEKCIYIYIYIKIFVFAGGQQGKLEGRNPQNQTALKTH